MVSALILLAEGTEESEYTITYDVLVRGGISVRSALVPPCENQYVTCSRGVKIVPDIALPSASVAVAEYDALIIPGGAKGAETISSSSDVQALLKSMHDAGKVVGAICAGSLAIKAANLSRGAKITSHPSVKSQLEAGGLDYDYREERVVVSDRLITSRGPGTTFEFALALVTALVGASTAQEIAPPMILPSSV